MKRPITDQRDLFDPTDPDLSLLDGREVRPGIYLIGKPSFNQETGKWRILADAYGALCLVEVRLYWTEEGGAA